MLETLRHKTIPITFHYNFVGEKTIYYIIGISVIGIGISRYENYYIGILSVSADIEKAYRSYTATIDYLKQNKK